MYVFFFFFFLAAQREICLKVNIDFKDSDLVEGAQVAANDAQECRQSCQAVQECRFWTFEPE